MEKTPWQLPSLFLVLLYTSSTRSYTKTLKVAPQLRPFPRWSLFCDGPARPSPSPSFLPYVLPSVPLFVRIKVFRFLFVGLHAIHLKFSVCLDHTKIQNSFNLACYIPFWREFSPFVQWHFWCCALCYSPEIQRILYTYQDTERILILVILIFDGVIALYA